jgi:hypothetical protein
MNGAATLSRNIRRTGVPATKRGKVNPEYVKSVFDGPTAERLAKAQSHYTVGDDKQGTRIYHFHDCALDRLYSRIARQAKGRNDEDAARQEYAALLKYRHHWHSAGLEPSPKSVDLDRIFCPDAANMSGMAKSERQAFHRQQYRIAAEVVGHKGSILLDNFVCYDWSARIASEMSPYLFRKTVREAAQKLAKHWGI